MKNKFLPLLWDYPDLPQKQQGKLGVFFDEAKEDSMFGDAYAGYVAFIIDIVCFRRKANITVKEMDDIISAYDYPTEFADRLTTELSEYFDNHRR